MSRLGAVAALLGMAASTLPAQAPAQAVAESFAIERPATLAGHAVRGRLPVVRATVNGVAGLFLLDTGSTDTVVTPAFAVSAGIGQGAAVAGADSAGRHVAGQAAEGVRLVLGDGRSVRTLPKVVVLAIGPLEALGLAGVINPTALAGKGCIALDFAGGRGEIAAADSVACRTNGGASVAVPDAIGADGRPYLTLSTAKGGGEVRYLLDSGASRTRIPASAAVGVPALGATASAGVAGAVTSAALVGPLELRHGALRLAVGEASVARDGATPLLGFDVLQHCRIVLRAGGVMDFAVTGP